jgi:hypothetical protein
MKNIVIHMGIFFKIPLIPQNIAMGLHYVMDPFNCVLTNEYICLQFEHTIQSHRNTCLFLF